MSNREIQSQEPVTKLPLWLAILGMVIFVGSTVLAARLIWEQTVWTWERGPQMVGFSLAHGSGALLFLFPILLIVWTLVVAAVAIWSLIRRKRVAIFTWVPLGVVALLFLLMGLPEGFWERAFISQMAASPRASDLLVYAAYRGDVGTVKAIIAHGVPINAADHSDLRTSLHAAAVAGDFRTTEYLVSEGADLNVLDRSGDSPLELASERGHAEVVSFLEAHGAKMIRGDKAQHQQAIHDEVQQDIDEMNRAEAEDQKLQDDIKRAARKEQNQTNKPR